jgi:hypothetical protein
MMKNGQRVRSAADWNQVRRPEIVRLFETHVYGKTPARRIRGRFKFGSIDPRALGGTAIRKQVAIRFSEDASSPTLNLLLYTPANVSKPVPVFLGLNFGGNHTIHSDPGIALAETWIRDPGWAEGGTRELTPHIRKLAEESSRGRASGRWQLEKILAGGFGLATLYCGDIEPDFNGGLEHGVRALFLPKGQKPARDEWGTIAAWAWGLSRAADYLETDKNVDGKRISVMGHSRLGKTALWAGAQDTRFAIVISNDSGEGGAALSRRKFGEDLRHLNTHFPHWFCTNYHQYIDREDELPVDQHMLLALIAPRPLYVASAAEDLHADPRGEFLSAVHAGRVYELLGEKGLGTDEMPAVHQPIMNTIGYHVRAGKHDVTAYDWDQYLAFAERVFARK